MFHKVSKNQGEIPFISGQKNKGELMSEIVFFPMDSNVLATLNYYRKNSLNDSFVFTRAAKLLFYPIG